MAAQTFFWHDYETFGADPARDRPVQFAGLRTDEDLNPVAEPLVIFARPTDDYLPNPDACLITGITPQLAQDKGLPECEFIARIHAELAAPGTCGVGYNSLRFDDEITRFTLYRNFFDPYAREWQNGCSRWDIIDMLRAAWALRPEGIEWPQREDGLPSFRLEELTVANGIEHSAAHDALADVQATIAMAQKVRQCQPRLYDYLLANRSKQSVQSMLDLAAMKPLLHVSGMFGAARHNIGLIVPLSVHPEIRNEIICYDLSQDPTPLIDGQADELRALLYTRGADLPAGVARPGLKSVHINRCPVLVPAKMADPATAARLELDGAACRAHLAQLRTWRASDPKGFAAKLAAIYERREDDRPRDPDTMLYSGGFLSDADRRVLDSVRGLPPAALADAVFGFEDARLPEMLFRYRARNYPETLSIEERLQWDEFRYRRLSGEDAFAGLDMEAFHARLDELLESHSLNPQQSAILADLQDWADQLVA